MFEMKTETTNFLAACNRKEMESSVKLSLKIAMLWKTPISATLKPQFLI
jgi:hypothetical protein